MSDLRPNAELAYRILDHIDADPAGWDQSVWIGQAACGTVACFAGWACLLSGDQPGPVDDDPETEYVHVAWQSGTEYIPLRAAELLGIELLGIEFGHRLFDANVTREALEREVADVFGPRPERVS